MNDKTQDSAASIQSIASTLKEAKDRLKWAEDVAQMVPELRRNVKILERAYQALTSTPSPRRTVGPTIKDSILEALEAHGGRMEFEPGKMLATVHGETGGKKNSVQVELHRMRSSGRIRVERDADNKPVAIEVVKPPLTALPGGADMLEVREG